VIAVAVVPVLLVTLLIGARGVAAMRTTSDFLVASRRISPAVNAAAVSGEYLSAASFLGVAGLVVKDGVGALWYPVGFAAGYIAMLALVAAPMRRTGALTVPDFAEARLGSSGLRKLSAAVVLVIGCLYLVPQFTAAGQVLAVVSGSPYWVGVVIAGAAVSITLALGGMRAATYVQAFQFGLKLVLFIVPAVWLLLQVGPDTRRDALEPVEFSRFAAATPVEFRLDTDLTITEPTPVSIAGGAARSLAPGATRRRPGAPGCSGPGPRCRRSAAGRRAGRAGRARCSTRPTPGTRCSPPGRYWWPPCSGRWACRTS
jgi:cation/acetate symporter